MPSPRSDTASLASGEGGAGPGSDDGSTVISLFDDGDLAVQQAFV